jgi:hypothetical protein
LELIKKNKNKKRRKKERKKEYICNDVTLELRCWGCAFSWHVIRDE